MSFWCDGGHQTNNMRASEASWYRSHRSFCCTSQTSCWCFGLFCINNQLVRNSWKSLERIRSRIRKKSLDTEKLLGHKRKHSRVSVWCSVNSAHVSSQTAHEKIFEEIFCLLSRETGSDTVCFHLRLMREN